jgi:RND family efflux transporter MFP subunit
MNHMTTNLPQGRRRLALPVASAALLCVIGLGAAMRWEQARDAQAFAAASRMPTVAIIEPSRVPAGALELPARIEAWSQAAIHARVSGYLRSRTVDIGDRVGRGQVLAEIDTPELDLDVEQARADLGAARSEAALASASAARWQSLLESDSVSRQEVDERTADSSARQARSQALAATVRRAETLLRYKRLVAPFAGVVTARTAEIGFLVSAGSGEPLFVVSDVSRLRLYVTVPQRQVGQIRPGDRAEVSIPERPGATFSATVESLAQAIDARTGGMEVLLVAENPDGALVPGGFAGVRFATVERSAGISIPPSALILGTAGPRVAVLGAQNRVRIKPVTIARDYGNVVEIGTGLEADERVIDSPPEGLVEGEVVRVAAAVPRGSET